MKISKHAPPAHRPAAGRPARANAALPPPPSTFGRPQRARGHVALQVPANAEPPKKLSHKAQAALARAEEAVRQLGKGAATVEVIEDVAPRRTRAHPNPAPRPRTAATDGAAFAARTASPAPARTAAPPSPWLMALPRTGTTMDWFRMAPRRDPPLKVDASSRLSNDFRGWLAKNGYPDLAALDLPAFGGFEKANGEPKKDPVIFIHGNQSTAADLQPVLGAYADAGYSFGELYAVTWYDRPKEEYDQSTHAAPTLKMLRRFITAVKQYTGAEKVDVVGHSLGVTLGRKAIKGGMLNDPDNGGWQDLGEPLTELVDTFVGVAGANRGLQYADIWKDSPMCNEQNGLHWQSDLIKDLNSETGYEGDHVYSIYSPTSDQVLLHEALRSGPIPGEDGGRSVDVWDLDHWDTMMLTGEIQVQMLEHHRPYAGLPDRNINALYDYMVRAAETNALTLDIVTRKLPLQLIKNWVDFLNGKS